MSKKYLYQILSIISLLTITRLFIGCEESKTIEQKIHVTSDNPQKIGKEGGQIEINISSNISWEITYDSDWVSFPETTRGEGSKIVPVLVAENRELKERSGIITISSSEKKIDVEIIQDPYSLEIKSPSILFTIDELELLKEATKNAGSGSLRIAYSNLISKSNSGLNFIPNPYTGQDAFVFLQNIDASASFARDLALSYHLTGNPSYAEKSLSILNVWSTECKTIMYDITASTSMYIARSIFPMVSAFDLLKNTEYNTETINSNVEAWFKSILPQIRDGVFLWEKNDYFNKQEYQNHLVAHMMGVLALGLVLEDNDAIGFALDSPENPRDFYELIEGCIFMEGDTPHHREDPNSPSPETGEIYDRYRHKTGPVRGLQYSHLTLSLLTTAARMCDNNGLDMFAYTAPAGENIGLSFQYYSDFYRLMDSCIKTRFYCGETDRIGKAGDDHGLFEIGMRYYPEYNEIKQLVHSGVYNRGTNYSSIHGFYRFYSVPIDSEN